MTKNFEFPTTGISVRDRATVLAIDDVLLPLKNHLCYYLTKPQVLPGPVLEPGPRTEHRPDDMASHFYGTVLREGGRFRMWYYACHWRRNPNWDPKIARQLAKCTGDLFQGPLCYAESEDGVNWIRPSLKQVDFKGDTDNNILRLPHGWVATPAVLHDAEDPDPQRRYKMVYEFWPEFTDPPIEENGRIPTIATAVSVDGLNWTPTGIPYRNEFIEPSSFYKHDGRYLVNHQGWSRGEGGSRCGRRGLVRFSHDFDHWVDGHVESFVLPEPRDPTQRGGDFEYDQVHIGVGAASYGTACVGLYGLWHSAHRTTAFDKISCDLGLVVSCDGLHFHEPVKGHVYIDSRDSPATPFPGRSYNTILCQGNGILNVGDETFIYHGRWRNAGCPSDIAHYGAEVGLATIPRDRWGALGLFPEDEEGTVWSAPVSLPEFGCQLSLNAEGAEGMRVDVSDPDFHLHAGFSGNMSGGCTQASGLDSPVSWSGRGLEEFSGRTVRFRINLKKGSPEPRLYALNLW